MLFVWQIYVPGEGYTFCEAMDGLTEEYRTALMLGEPLAPPLPTFEVKRLTAGTLGDMLGTGWSAMLLSDRIRACLPDDIVQFVPVTLPVPSPQAYHLANFLELRKGFDYERSEYELNDGDPLDIERVKSLHLSFDDPDLPPVFRLWELPFVILVQAELRERIEAVSASPGHFIRPEDYSYGYLP
jgi:hypothetical protein